MRLVHFVGLVTRERREQGEAAVFGEREPFVREKEVGARRAATEEETERSLDGRAAESLIVDVGPERRAASSRADHDHRSALEKREQKR